MSKLILIIFLIHLSTLSLAQESIQITGLPNQSEEIYEGWIFSSNETQSYLFYQLYSAQGTKLNSSSTIPLIIYLAGGPCAS